MREIKFRAWDKQRKKMLAPDEGTRLDYQSVVGYAESIASDWGITARGDFFFRELRGMTWPKNEFALMQYTGLKDKNGVEIYEGDIVSRVGGGLLGDPTKVMFTGEVVFTNSGYKAKYLYDEPGTAGRYRHEAHGNIFNQSELEVIGNIYENPELLEATS